MKKRIYPLLLSVLLECACHKHPEKTSTDPWLAYRKAYEQIKINSESAFRQFNIIAENSQDKQQTALAYYNMALIQSDAGDYFGAQESLISSIRSLNANNVTDRGYMASNYNELSVTSYNLQDYTAALTYAGTAARFTTDPAILQHININRGNAYQKLKQFDKAIENYRRAIRLTDGKGTVFARALTNLATSRWLKNPRFKASDDLKRAVDIYRGANDLWGLNSAYAHLADYYLTLHPDSAFYYARKMLGVSIQLHSGDDQLEALQKLGLLYGDKDIRKVFTRYQYLSDSLASVRRSAKNQFAVIRYDVEKSKSENLRLQNENSKKEYLLLTFIIIVLIGSFSSVIWYRKRKEFLRAESENRIRQDRLKLSQKVHDVVANGIYRVMNEVELKDEVDKEYLLDRLDRMYEQSRHISHDNHRPENTPFSLRIEQMLNAFKNADISLAVLGNDEKTWSKINNVIQTELELILQELMVNMDKHSHATYAMIKFELISNTLMVTYRDNGIGIQQNEHFGTGLKNTENRIRSLGGQLKFDAGEEKGLLLHITIPLSLYV